MTTISLRSRKKLAVGLAFLAPNILGFLAFTLLPLVFALVLAFTNWDLRLHNQFKNEPLRFVGIDNFLHLLFEPNFWRYLGNTLFLMLGIPFGIAGSLIAAILLSRDLRGGRRAWLMIIIASGLLSGIGVMVMMGMSATAMVMLIGGLAGMILFGGAIGGTTVYRTLFYLPHFTAGVATFILWKKLYSPYTGPINLALTPVLDTLTHMVNSVPAPAIQALAWLLAMGMIGTYIFGLSRIWVWWSGGDLALPGSFMAALFLILPATFSLDWSPTHSMGLFICGVAIASLSVLLFMMSVTRRVLRPAGPGEGFGSALMFSVVIMVIQFVLMGLAIVVYRLPMMADGPQGLEPPSWLSNVYWAKPSLMIMGFWASIGSNNMLLYLAGLAGVPPELYEAADIDGAGRFAKFWHVTWPQLAPVTFFIVVMSVIHGLQGGFEMARAMTNGGPAGATTTLSYYVYMEGFETGRLGYASAITWTLFGLVFMVTLFNWKFGNRYVNN